MHFLNFGDKQKKKLSEMMLWDQIDVKKASHIESATGSDGDNYNVLLYTQ